MAVNTYFWTKDNAYCVVINSITKKLSIDYFPSNTDKSKCAFIFNNTCASAYDSRNL